MKHIHNHLISSSNLSAGWVMAILTALFSCVRDGQSDCPKPDTNKYVTLWISTPAGRNPDSRAIGADEESAIKSVDILAFKIDGANETFVYSATASPVSMGTTGGVQQFTASLRIVPYQQRFVLITNAHTEVTAAYGSGTWAGADKSTMLAKLQSKLSTDAGDRWNATSPSNYTSIPMWGESAPETISAATKKLSATVYMLRMTARIDAKLDTSVAGLTDRFKLKSVNIYNTNMGGAIVPAASTVVREVRDSQPYIYVNAPTIPSEWQSDAARHFGPIVYTDFTDPGAADVSMAGAIYLYESAAQTDDARATYLVIGGVYGTDTVPTYYRVDFYKSGTNTRLDILRNYRYLFNIINVSGPGHTTADEASTSKSANMTVEVLQWNESGLDNIKFDGVNFLAVSRDAVPLYSNAYAGATPTKDNVFTVLTDVAAGWTVDKIVNAADGTTVVNWLNVAPPSGAAGSKTDVVINALRNTTGTSRSALVTIVAGRLRFPVKVTQGTASAPLTLDLRDGNNSVITELIFSAPADQIPSTQKLNVIWQPIDKSVTVASDQNAGAVATFPSNSGAPNNGDVLTSLGSASYVMTPPALTTAELVANPFLEKASKVDFTLSDGQSTLTKTVILRQLSYQVIANAAPYYTINGSSYSFNVRSNAKWVIKSITEKPNTTYQAFTSISMLNNKSTDNLRTGAAGGPNTSPAGGGDPVSFTTATTLGSWGTINVVFASPDTPAKFADTNVTLVMAAPTISIVGQGVAVGGEGGDKYNLVTIPGGGNTPYDASTMMTTTRNFGVQPTSTVIVPPFTLTWINQNNTGGVNYTMTTADVQKAVDKNPDLYWIGGNTQWGDDVSVMIKRKFLDLGKTVVCSVQHYPTLQSMINTIFGSSWVQSIPITYESNYQAAVGATYQFLDTADPVAVGPFGDLRGKYWGSQWNGVYGIYNLPPEVSTRYSTIQNQSGATTVGGQANNCFTAFRLKQVNLIWLCDDGFLRSDTQNGTNVSPFYIDPTTKVPATKLYGGSSPQQQVSNSVFIANMLAWVVARNPQK